MGIFPTVFTAINGIPFWLAVEFKEPKAWIDAIIAVLKLIFQDQVPPYVLRSVGYALAFGAMLLACWGLLFVFWKIKELWIAQFWPMFYNAEEKRRGELRRRFADHVESEVRRLNSLEQWSDHRFAELEAEVEAEGNGRTVGMFRFFPRTHNALRRERSLSRALQMSRERLILLEGEPGAGKSVALRHLAQSMAQRAMRVKKTDTLIPIYLNLKELERGNKQQVDSALIRSFVLRSLNRINDRDIDDFLEHEFDKGLKKGTWLFLFDSFDETPEVLSSVEADAAISRYSDAIANFLGGLNECRGIIASRQFRGPGQLGWPRFRILALSKARRSELIRRAALRRAAELELLGNLEASRDEIQLMASNPMFLGLLAEYIRVGNEFPENVHVVFEKYIQNRLDRDATKLERRFGLKPAQLRVTAEHVAFCMAADTCIGLSPSREALKVSLFTFKFQTLAFDKTLNALEFIKLARSESSTLAGDSKPFTFAHRRFQEYFATCVVLREPNRVTPLQLLTDGRWRETAVVLCQTQRLEDLSSLIYEANEEIDRIHHCLPSGTQFNESSGSEAKAEENLPKAAYSGGKLFPWPQKSLHMMNILQDGFSGRFDDLPDDLRMKIGDLVSVASNSGTLLDQKWALEVAGLAPRPVLLSLLRHGFESESQWLRDTAYRQTAGLVDVPDDISSWIRSTLLKMALVGRLFRERHTTRVHIARLNKRSELLAAHRLLLWLPVIEISLYVMFLWILIKTSFGQMGFVFSTLAVSVAIFNISTATRYMLVSSAQQFPGLKHFAYAILFQLYSLSLLVLTVFRRSVVGNLNDRVSFHRMLHLVTLSLLRCPWWVLTTAVIAAVWMPLAVFSVRAGEFMSPIFWIIMPSQPLLYFSRNTAVRVRAAVVSVKGQLPFVITVVVMAMLLIGGALDKTIDAAVFLVIAFFKAHPWLSYIYYGGGCVFAVYGLGIFANWVLAYAMDYQQWRKWSYLSPAAADASSLFKMLGRYRTDRFRVRMIRSIRVNGLLPPSGESEDLLARLAVWVENDARFSRENLELPTREVVDASGHIPETQFVTAIKGGLWRWGPEPIDELYKLLEQVKDYRIDETASR